MACSGLLMMVSVALLTPLAAQVTLFPGVASVDGENQTRWRSELVLFNPGETEQTVRLEILARDTAATAAASDLVLGPGERLQMDDVYTALGAPDGAGALVVDGAVLAWVRTFNLGADGTFGQSVPGVASPPHLPGYEVLFPVSTPADVATDFRSNLVLLNLEQDGARFTLTAGGTSRIVTVPAGTYVQVNDVGGELALAAGASMLSVLADRTWAGYVSTVDPGLGDPTTVLGLVAESVEEEEAVITGQPQDSTVAAGGAATLSVTASGTPPLAFQWFRGSSGDTSAPVDGAAGPSMTTPALAGTTGFWVRVVNPLGWSDSRTATVTVTDAVVATPTVDPPPGTYRQDLEVTLACATAGALIHYTTDGSDPTGASPVYDGQPIPVTGHVTADNDPDPWDEHQPVTQVSLELRAVAVLGEAESETVLARYVLDKVDVTFGIAYDEPPAEGGSKHQLDVYQPHGVTGTPVLLFIHGGAWKQGDKNIYLELGNTFSGYYGLTTVIANYRLSADPWNAVHPDHISDVARAFAWTVEHIDEYGGNPDDITVFGQSAGGHLVSLLATDPSYLAAEGLSPDRIRGVVTMSGSYDLWSLVAFPGNPLGLGADEVLAYKALMLNAFGGWDQDRLDAASPSAYVNAAQPPFQVIYAWEDMAGFGDEAVAFYDQIVSLGGPRAELVLLLESDIPPEVLALDLGGHYEEVYSINTRDWDSRSARVVADFVGSLR